MPRINNDQRNQAILMLWTGTDIDQVAGAFVVLRTTISRHRDKFANTGSVEDKPRPGQSRTSTAQDHNGLTLRVLQNHKITARKLQRDLDLQKVRNVWLSKHTTCRCIKASKHQIILVII